MIECDGSGFLETYRELGDRGITETQLGHNPAGFTSTLFGSESFALISATDREIIYELCRREQNILIEAAFDDHKGLIVCPTASPYLFSQGETCLSQFKAMVQTVLEYKP